MKVSSSLMTCQIHQIIKKLLTLATCTFCAWLFRQLFMNSELGGLRINYLRRCAREKRFRLQCQTHQADLCHSYHYLILLLFFSISAQYLKGPHCDRQTHRGRCQGSSCRSSERGFRTHNIPQTEPRRHTNSNECMPKVRAHYQTLMNVCQRYVHIIKL